MKMTKILLTAVLLVSARAFAMDSETAKQAQASIFARARQAAGRLLTTGFSKVSNGAKVVWGKVPGMPESAKAKLATGYGWAKDKGVTASSWVVTHTPESVKQALSNKRNLKIVGVVAALATAATCWHFFGDKLQSKKTAAN